MRALGLILAAAGLAFGAGAQPQGRMETPWPPLPDAGETEAFSFARSLEYEGVFVVRPRDGSEPIYVSESFMELTVRDPRLNSESKLTVLRNYQQTTQSQFDMTIGRSYPDASRADETAFAGQVLGGGNEGLQAMLAQDPLAPPYVRVRLSSADGSTEEFSIAREAAQRVLGDARLSDSQKINALRTFPFRLPDDVRRRFSTMSKEDFLQAVVQSPELRRQEFVRMREVYEKVAQAKAQSAAAPAAQAPAAAASPAPPPSPQAASAPPWKATPRPRPVATPGAQADEAAQAPDSPPSNPKADHALNRGPALAAALIVAASLAAFGVYLGQRRRL